MLSEVLDHNEALMRMYADQEHGRERYMRQSDNSRYSQIPGDEPWTEYAETLYNRGKEWFVEKPYKGLGAIGAMFGGAAGLAAGPIGVLIGMAVGSAASSGVGAAGYWAWGRGKLAPGDYEFLNKRSLFKWLLDTVSGLELKLFIK